MAGQSPEFPVQVHPADTQISFRIRGRELRVGMVLFGDFTKTIQQGLSCGEISGVSVLGCSSCFRTSKTRFRFISEPLKQQAFCGVSLHSGLSGRGKIQKRPPRVRTFL
jgi:hypothetical protein